MTHRNGPTDPETLSRARQLRHDLTFPERKLWAVLRGRRLAGHKFRRQAPIGPFIVDFLQSSSKLIIELDGRSHDDRGIKDHSRQTWLEGEGFRVLRFSNDDVLTDIEMVLEAIDHHFVLLSKSVTGIPPEESATTTLDPSLSPIRGTT